MVRRRVGEGKAGGWMAARSGALRWRQGARSRAGEQWRQEEEGGGIEPGTDLQYQRKAGSSL
jgi:hypothetical protein